MISSEEQRTITYFSAAATMHFQLKEALPGNNKFNLAYYEKNDLSDVWAYRARAMNLRKFFFAKDKDSVRITQIIQIMITVATNAHSAGVEDAQDLLSALKTSSEIVNTEKYANGIHYGFGKLKESNNHKLMELYLYGVLLHSDRSKFDQVLKYGIQQTAWDSLIFHWVGRAEGVLQTVYQNLLWMHRRELLQIPWEYMPPQAQALFEQPRPLTED